MTGAHLSLLFLVTLPLGMAGCLTTGGGEASGEATSSPLVDEDAAPRLLDQGFVADYSIDGAPDGAFVRLVLSSGNAMWQDGRVHASHRLDFQAVGPFTTEDTWARPKTFWLDSDSHIQRIDGHCGRAGSDWICPSWGAAGAMPPMGMGYLHLFATGNHTLSFSTGGMTVSAVRERIETGWRLQVPSPSIPIVMDADWGGNYEYNTTGPAPVAIHGSALLGGNSARLQRFAWTPLTLLAQADEAGAPPRAVGQWGSVSRLFPDADVPVLGMRASAKEAYDFAMAQPEVREFVGTTGCLAAVFMLPNATVAYLGLVDEVTENFGLAFLNAAGTFRQWDARYTYVTIPVDAGNEWTIARSPEAEFPNWGTCGSPPLPTVGAQDFVAAALPVVDWIGTRAYSVSWRLPRPYMEAYVYALSIPEQGATDSGTFLLHNISLNSATGAWRSANLPGSALQRLDTEGLELPARSASG